MMAVNVAMMISPAATRGGPALGGQSPPPDAALFQTTAASDDSLICNEVLDMNELNKTPQHQPHQPVFHDFSEDNFHSSSMLISADSLPPTVMAVSDPTQLNDSRVLQNLLQNEHRFSPSVPDFMTNVQRGQITAEHRKLVADWMLGIVHEKQSQPEVFCVAINLMDRFLCTCQIRKSQLQLLGAVCVLVASKIREPRPIPGSDLIRYTDDSITPDELKEWELLVLYKLHWELSSITPIDYLDQALPRLGLNEDCIDLTDLRNRTQTILVLAATDYQFAYHTPSLLAASAIITAIQSLSTPLMAPPPPQEQETSSAAVAAAQSADLSAVFDDGEELQTLTTCRQILNHPQKSDVMRELTLRLQTVTHTATVDIEKCTEALTVILPELYRGIHEQFMVPTDQPDSTSHVGDDDVIEDDVTDEDLTCQEAFHEDDDDNRSRNSNHSSAASSHCSKDVYTLAVSGTAAMGGGANGGGEFPGSSRSSSPLSAVDIFTEYNTNVLQAIFDQVEQQQDQTAAKEQSEPAPPPSPSQSADPQLASKPDQAKATADVDSSSYTILVS